jgi:hypothetical protein
MTEKPLAIDLCCGRGGWARGFVEAGWRVIGFDLEDFSAVYPGEFRLCDIRVLRGSMFPDARLFLASSPCDEFSRFAMPWTRKRNPPYPANGMLLFRHCERIAREASKPILLENVRAASAFIGPALAHYGPFYLWGDVPALLPAGVEMKKKESYGSKDRAKRAEIPLALSRWVASLAWE